MAYNNDSFAQGGQKMDLAPGVRANRGQIDRVEIYPSLEASHFTTLVSIKTLADHITKLNAARIDRGQVIILNSYKPGGYEQQVKEGVGNSYLPTWLKTTAGEGEVWEVSPEEKARLMTYSGQRVFVYWLYNTGRLVGNSEDGENWYGQEHILTVTPMGSGEDGVEIVRIDFRQQNPKYDILREQVVDFTTDSDVEISLLNSVMPVYINVISSSTTAITFEVYDMQNLGKTAMVSADFAIKKGTATVSISGALAVDANIPHRYTATVSTTAGAHTIGTKDASLMTTKGYQTPEGKETSFTVA